MSSKEQPSPYKCPGCKKEGGVTSMPRDVIFWKCNNCKRIFSLTDVVRFNKASENKNEITN